MKNRLSINSFAAAETHLEPLRAEQHQGWRYQPLESVPAWAACNACPLVLDEFSLASKTYPILFAGDPEPEAVALMGLLPDRNVFLEGNGRMRSEEDYVPAYMRQYPFAMARSDTDEAWGHEGLYDLCFAPSSDAVGPFRGGIALFENGALSAEAKGIAEFCGQYAEAGIRTHRWLALLEETGLLMDASFTLENSATGAFHIGGFRMVDEDRLAALTGDELANLHEVGALALIYAHLLSLANARILLSRHVKEGDGAALLEAFG